MVKLIWLHCDAQSMYSGTVLCKVVQTNFVEFCSLFSQNFGGVWCLWKQTFRNISKNLWWIWQSQANYFCSSTVETIYFRVSKNNCWNFYSYYLILFIFSENPQNSLNSIWIAFHSTVLEILAIDNVYHPVISNVLSKLSLSGTETHSPFSLWM